MNRIRISHQHLPPMVAVLAVLVVVLLLSRLLLLPMLAVAYPTTTYCRHGHRH